MQVERKVYEDFVGDMKRAASFVYCNTCEQDIPTNGGGVHTCTCAREARGEECTLDECAIHHSKSKKTDKEMKNGYKKYASEYDSTQSVQSAQRRGILEFALPEESCAFKIAVNSMDFVIALNEFDSWLWTQTKHNPDGLNYEQQQLLHAVRLKLHDELSDYNVSLEMLE